MGLMLPEMPRPSTKPKSSEKHVAHDLTFHERQAEVWSAPHRFKCIAAGRRGGKSEYGVTWKLTEARKSDLAGYKHAEHWVVAPSYKILGVLWAKFLRQAPPGWITGMNGTQDNPGVLKVGRARIVFRSAANYKNLVAEGLRSLWIDESGVIDFDKVFYESLRPAMADYKAPALFTGTPKGRNGFYRIWMQGQDPLNNEVGSWRWHSVANPFVEADEIGAIERTLPRRTVLQEIWARFLKGAGDVFLALDKNILTAKRLFGGDGRCPHPTKWVGVDLGKQIDFTVMVGLCKYGHMTGFQRFKDLPWPVITARIANVLEEEEDCIGVVDEAGLGAPVVGELQRLVGHSKIIPVQTGAQKVDLIEGHILAVEKENVLMADIPELRNEHEAFTYEYTRRGRIMYGAPQGVHDDCVTAAALASWGFTSGPPPLEFGVARTGV